MTLPESRKKRFTYPLVEISCWSFYLLFTCETTCESWGEGEGWRGWSDYWGYFMIFLFWESRIKSNFLVLVLTTWKSQAPCVVSDSCDLMDWNPPGPSVHGIFQARILEWVAIFFSKATCLFLQKNLPILSWDENFTSCTAYYSRC